MGSANLLLAPEAFDNAAWSKLNAAVTADATANPYGPITADKVLDTAATAQHYLQQNIVRGAIERQDVFSIFLKAGEYTSAALYLTDQTGYARLDINNLATGAVSMFNLGTGLSNVANGSTDFGNGWRRYWITALLPAATIGSFANVFPNGTHSYLGTGTSGVYAYGAQLEPGSTPTPYVDVSRRRRRLITVRGIPRGRPGASRFF